MDRPGPAGRDRDPLTSAPALRVLAAGGGRPMRGGSHELRAGTGDTAGALTVWQSATPFGKGPPLHVHEHEDELFYVLAGRYALVCGEVEEVAPAGSLMFLPRRTPHTFRSVGEDGPGRLLQCSVPGGMEEYFGAIADSDAATSEGRRLRQAAGLRFGLRFPDDPRARLDGAEHEPPFRLDPPRAGRDGCESQRIARLDFAASHGRLALDEIYVEPGAEWRLEADRVVRVVHALSGTVELDAGGGAAAMPAGGTACLPPGASCRLRSLGAAAARLVVLGAPLPTDPPARSG